MDDIAREVVSINRLQELLNEHLAEFDVCDDCRFDGPIYLLQGPDEVGCNWSDQITIRCSGRSMTTSCLRAVLQVLEEAREQYNVSEAIP